MAAKKPAAKSNSTALATWDEQLANQAAIAAGMEESTASGQFFSMKGGILSWNDAPIPGNQMAVVILDSILENVFYDGAYDPETPQGPMCFAFGRDDKTLAPHQIVVDAGNQQCGVSGLCAGCDMNEFGTANIGKGKACRNTRRLAMIPAGVFDNNGKFVMQEDEDHYSTAAVGFMKLPVTSVKGYAAFVKQITGALKRPPHGIIAKVYVTPDPKSQFKVFFEAIMKVPDNLMGAIMARHEEAKAIIDFPYTPFEEEETPAPAKRVKPSNKAARPAVKRGARKY